jgi:hypothetical protein
LRLSHLPWMDKRQMEELLALAEFRDEGGLGALRPPFALVSVYDCVTERQVLMVGPVDLVRQKGYVRVEVETLAGRVVRARHIAPAS